jgi:hypothetical protein
VGEGAEEKALPGRFKCDSSKCARFVSNPARPGIASCKLLAGPKRVHKKGVPRQLLVLHGQGAAPCHNRHKPPCLMHLCVVYTGPSRSAGGESQKGFRAERNSLSLGANARLARGTA